MEPAKECSNPKTSKMKEDVTNFICYDTRRVAKRRKGSGKR